MSCSRRTGAVAIAGFWEDLTFLRDESRIAYKTFSDLVVLTYENMGFRDDPPDSGARFTFQRIARADGTIDWQYQRADRPLGGAYTPGTAGITSPDLSQALLVSHKDGLLTAGQRVRVRPQRVWVSASSRTVAVPAGGSAVVQLTLDPAGLANGIHTASVPVTANTPRIPLQNVQITLGVGDVAGAFSLAASTVVTGEDSNALSLTVNRIGGSTGAVSVSWRIAGGGNATEGEDFSGGGGTLAWPDGDNSPRTILIPIIDDLLAEGDERFVVEFYNPNGGAALGVQASVQVIIRDNDHPVGPAPVLTAAAAQALAARFRAGQLPLRHGGYYPGRPFREPVLLELRDDSGEVSAVVTRNSFGCAVLNAARALFAGVDLPRPKPRGLFARLLGKPAPPPALTQDAVLARAEEWALRHPGWGWRVYRTPAGLRLLATHALFEPSSPVVEEVFEALGADPLYRRLCRAQKCFRARLTPKPWRCGMPGRPPRWPWQNPEEERQFQEWEARYRARAAEWAACNFLHTIGNPAVHPAIAQILRVHDEAARADSGLETA